MTGPSDPLVIAPNLKRRLSGVTATIARLVPVQAKMIAIRATGPGLPEDVPHMSLARVLVLDRRTRRVWHARRNTEMLLGLILREVLRKNLALLFTSASQRKHSGYTKWLIAQMDAIVATSSKTAGYLERPSDVVMHGIDTNQFRPPEDKAALRRALDLPEGRLVGCFGRVRAQKGTDLFVDAMIALCRRHADLHGLVLGRATEKHQGFLAGLRARVDGSGLSDRIHFRDEVPVDQIARWYQALDLFVAPQRWEGFGLTPLEAMACGVPVVAADVGAFSTLIVPSVTGEVVTKDDLSTLSDAMGRVLEGDARTTEMGKAARAHVEANFTLKQEAEALVQIYLKLLETT